ncbi:NUDIX hydrolase [Rhodovulum adriaticum]|uniref:NUDIX domain-containing protein n=1 Tax=Rhodovulum adriaticum TaxID=35804 RepID=A0A4R2NND7_RHOAD|nr:NUDIX hydrolase [Rhodovulum adriaticum]MBK1636919.1 NUDIX hydrolase [Rhodovulum adriaticum]TCP22805.1 NUDIX domain-containing protein [Rhodovulum adriaticum]
MDQPLLPARARQIAALPLHRDAGGRLQVLMVTSRRTKRWVMPKGWHMDGKKPWRAAEIEALEEAGAVGHIATTPIGEYTYDKILDNGDGLPCTVEVFPMLVDRLKRNWKERKERKRHWFNLRQAAKRVDEPDLAALLNRLHKDQDKHPELRALIKSARAR